MSARAIQFPLKNDAGTLQRTFTLPFHVIALDHEPGAADDDIDGYVPLSMVEFDNRAFVCLDNSTGAAVWVEVVADGPDDDFDDEAIHDNVSGEINAIAEKADPDEDDVLIIEDSEDSYAKKKIKISSLMAMVGGWALSASIWLSTGGLVLGGTHYVPDYPTGGIVFGGGTFDPDFPSGGLVFGGSGEDFELPEGGIVFGGSAFDPEIPTGGVVFGGEAEVTFEP